MALPTHVFERQSTATTSVIQSSFIELKGYFKPDGLSYIYVSPYETLFRDFAKTLTLFNQETREILSNEIDPTSDDNEIDQELISGFRELVIVKPSNIDRASFGSPTLLAPIDPNITAMLSQPGPSSNLFVVIYIGTFIVDGLLVPIATCVDIETSKIATFLLSELSYEPNPAKGVKFSEFKQRREDYYKTNSFMLSVGYQDETLVIKQFPQLLSVVSKPSTEGYGAIYYWPSSNIGDVVQSYSTTKSYPNQLPYLNVYLLFGQTASETTTLNTLVSASSMLSVPTTSKANSVTIIIQNSIQNFHEFNIVLNEMYGRIFESYYSYLGSHKDETVFRTARDYLMSLIDVISNQDAFYSPISEGMRLFEKGNLPSESFGLPFFGMRDTTLDAELTAANVATNIATTELLPKDTLLSLSLYEEVGSVVPSDGWNASAFLLHRIHPTPVKTASGFSLYGYFSSFPFSNGVFKKRDPQCWFLPLAWFLKMGVLQNETLDFAVPSISYLHFPLVDESVMAVPSFLPSLIPHIKITPKNKPSPNPPVTGKLASSTNLLNVAKILPFVNYVVKATESAWWDIDPTKTTPFLQNNVVDFDYEIFTSLIGLKAATTPDEPKTVLNNYGYIAKGPTPTTEIEAVKMVRNQMLFSWAAHGLHGPNFSNGLFRHTHNGKKYIITSIQIKDAKLFVRTVGNPNLVEESNLATIAIPSSSDTSNSPIPVLGFDQLDASVASRSKIFKGTNFSTIGKEPVEIIPMPFPPNYGPISDNCSLFPLAYSIPLQYFSTTEIKNSEVIEPAPVSITLPTFLRVSNFRKIGTGFASVEESLLLKYFTTGSIVSDVEFKFDDPAGSPTFKETITETVYKVLEDQAAFFNDGDVLFKKTVSNAKALKIEAILDDKASAGPTGGPTRPPKPPRRPTGPTGPTGGPTTPPRPPVRAAKKVVDPRTIERKELQNRVAKTVSNVSNIPSFPGSIVARTMRDDTDASFKSRTQYLTTVFTKAILDPTTTKGFFETQPNYTQAVDDIQNWLSDSAFGTKLLDIKKFKLKAMEAKPYISVEWHDQGKLISKTVNSEIFCGELDEDDGDFKVGEARFVRSIHSTPPQTYYHKWLLALVMEEKETPVQFNEGVDLCDRKDKLATFGEDVHVRFMDAPTQFFVKLNTGNCFEHVVGGTDVYRFIRHDFGKNSYSRGVGYCFKVVLKRNIEETQWRPILYYTNATFWS